MEKRLFSKKTLSLFLAVIMLVALLPISSMAATCEVCGGDGVITDDENNETPCTNPDCVGGTVPDPVDPPPEIVRPAGCTCPEGESHSSSNTDCVLNVPEIVRPAGCTCPEGTSHSASNASCALNVPEVVRPEGCTCPAGTSHSSSNTECHLYVAPEIVRPEGCTCPAGESHDPDNTECAKYVAPEIVRPEGCTCPSGESHDPDNTECAKYVAPEPIVDTFAEVTYGEPTLGSVDVDIEWDEDIPVDTELSFALQYARQNDGQGSGVTQPLTVIDPANKATFTNVPVSVVKTTVTTTVTTPWSADAKAYLWDQQTRASETVEETVTYTYAPISATAGTGYRVTKDGLKLRVSVRPADEADATTNAVITLNWNNIPEDQDPKVNIRLLRNGTAVADSDTTLGKGASSFGYYGLPLRDADDSEITYSVAAERSTASDGGFTVSAEGLTVTVNWLDEETATSVLAEIADLISRLPSPAPAEGTDPSTIENLSDIRTRLTRIKALLNELTWAQMESINANLYYEWDYFLAVADGTLSEGISLLSFRDDEGEPSNQPIPISGNVAFHPAAGSVTPPRYVEIKLLQDGVVVRSQGVAITSNAGTFDFGNWPSYNGATNKPYIYAVSGASVTGYVASTGSSFAVNYDPAADTDTNQNYAVTVSFITTGATGADATPKATVQMFKNDNPVTGQSFEFSTTAGSHTFVVPIKSGDVVFPRPEAVNNYKVSISGLAITYTYVGNLTTFSGTINWVNASRFNKPPLWIKIKGTLKTGITGKDATVTASICTLRMDEDSTTYIFSELDADYTYAIESVTNTGSSVDDQYNKPTWSGTSITVTRTIDPLMRIGVHMRWVDNNNKRERRPSETTVYLYRDGVYTGDAVQILASDGWDAIFYDQPYSDGAHVYKYSVRAAKTHYYWSRTTRLSNFGFLITQFYGTRSSDTETNSGLTPKVGDPTLFRTVLSDSMYRQAAVSMEAVRNTAVLRENESDAGTVDFDTLKRLNKDVVAWITLDGTDIDYPIVKGTDNTKYLTRLFSGESNSSGSLFMDYRNSSNFGNRSTTVFGHNMKDGSMFNTLTKYEDQSFYDAHPSFSIQTPKGSFTAEPIAAFYTDAAYSNVVKRTFANNAAFINYVDRCIRASSIQSNATVAATDKLITFVTCDDDYTTNRRFLVVCKLSAD